MGKGMERSRRKKAGEAAVGCGRNRTKWALLNLSKVWKRC